MMSRTLWTLWALVPVAMLAWHFGPGQSAAAREVAATRLAVAIDADRAAVTAQQEAYAAHLETIAARRATFTDPGGGADAALTAAVAAEEAAYERAADLWERAAERYEDAIEAGGDLVDDDRHALILARSRALVRSGDIWGGASELRILIDELDPDGRALAGGDGDPVVRTVRAAREELATAHYFGARLLRLAGEPAEDWRAEAALARQQFRYLAEGASERGAAPDAIRAFEDNVERVIDLEEQDRSDLEGVPLPRESPRAARGSRPGSGQQAGKTREPRRGDQDARGASGVEAIGRGW